MPLPAGLQLYITSADGTKRRKLPRAQVESVSTQIERSGGYGQGTVSTAIPYQDAGTLTVQIGDRVETWFQGKRRYRGYVTAISPTEDEPHKVSITAFGVSLLLRKQFCDRSYAFPALGVDVSAAFSALAQDFLLKATGPGGERLIQSVQSLFVGTNIQYLDARQKLAGDIIDSLIKSAGNLAVWGCDVDSSGSDRLYFRPLSPVLPPTYAIPVPGKNVETATGEMQTADLVNQLFITGGAPIFPQLLHNGGFELPVYQESGAGNLVLNGGFEVAGDDHHVSQWALNNGAQSFTTFSFPPKQAAPFTENRCLGLEGAGQNAVQVTTTPLVTGHNYVLSVRAAKEMDQQVATGHALLQVYSGGNGSGSLLASLTVALTPTGQGYDYFSGTFAAPAGAASFSLTLACDTNDSSHVPNNNGYFGGLILDDIELYDGDVVYQDGWYTHSSDANEAFVNAVNWVYRDQAFEGGYAVYLDATGADADGHDLKLQPLAGSRYKVTPSQTLRFGVWLKSPPASPNPNPPKFFLEMNFYDSSGNITRTPPRATFTPGFLAQWTYFELVAFALNGETSGDANLTWRSSGSLLVDAMSVRDDQAPAMAAGSGQTAPVSPFLTDGPLVFFVAASDAGLNGVWRPANNLASPASYATSEALYGPRCGLFSDTSVLQLSDAYAVADSTFTSSAFPLYRPSVTVVNDARLFFPGETVRLIGADGPALSPVPLPIARVEDHYDGLLKTTLSLAKESPDVSLAIKRIVQDELLRLGPGSTNSSPASGYSSSTGGASGVGSGTQAVASVNAKTGAVVLAASDVGAEPALGDPAADGYVLSSTAAGVRSWVVPPAGTNGGALAPATASAFGGVETDITESGGSVVYTKTTTDGKFATQAALTTEANARTSADQAEATARANGDALALQKSQNLADVQSPSMARTNLGLGTAASLNVASSGNAAANQVVLGNDTRLGTASPVRQAVIVLGRPGSLATGLSNTAVTCPPGVTLTLIGLRSTLGSAGTSATTFCLSKSAGTGAASSTSGFSQSGTSQSVTIASGNKASNTNSINPAFTLASDDQFDLSVTAAGTGAVSLTVETIWSY